MRPATRARVVLLGVVVSALAGCTGSSGAGPSQSPDTTLHPIAACSPTASIPADVSTVTPSASKPPTSVLQVGDAMAFTAPSSSRIGAVGKSDAPEGAVVCQSSRGSGPARRAIILAIRPGFVQVGLVPPGTAVPRRTLVTVTD